MSLALHARDARASLLASSRRLVASHIPSKTEISAFPAPYRRAAIGLMVWLVLSGIVIVALLVVPTETQPIETRSRPSDAATGAPVPIRVDAIKARPLFDRSRRPAADTAPAAVPAPPTVVRDRSVKVVGIYIDGAMSKAFLTSDANQAGSWMTPGQAIGGWQILAIHPRSVDLGADPERLAVTLDTNPVGGH